jgi:hypothetical protein
VNERRSIGPALSAVSLLLAGCNAVPTSYAKWKDEQAKPAKFAEAGVPYKSPSEIRAEAEEMRRLSEATPFPAAKK